MTKKEITRGFKFFLCAHFFLWHLPKNSETLAGSFSICDQYARGKPFWKWASRISSLENKVTFWPKILDLESSEVNTISIDGVDKKRGNEEITQSSILTGKIIPKNMHMVVSSTKSCFVHSVNSVFIFMVPCVGVWVTRKCSQTARS